MSVHPVLNERSLSLLKILVERYISEGQPVGSKTLARESSISLSPASIRNIMADLEERGMVVSPHTSAGRVPTVKGYRLFVDTLLTIKPLQHTLIDQLKLQLDKDVRPQELIDSASLLLSHTTGMAGVVMLPRLDSVLLQQIEFIPLSDNRILVVLVVNDMEIQNRIIHTDRCYTQDELQRVANYLNAEFSGCELSSIRRGVHDSMQVVRDDMQQIMQVAMNMADNVLAQSGEDDLVIAGETNLMQYAEMADMDKLRQLFEAFNTKQDILHILDHSIHAEGMQIFIGEESGYSAFGDCSVVTAPYRIEDRVVGVLGVIGPTRMAYDRVIPVVDVTARILGSLLSSE